MPIEPQNLSREMTLYPMRCVSYLIGSYLTGTAHLANPAPYTQESSLKHRKSGCLWPARHSTSVENPLQIHPFLYKRTQSCPPPADSKPFIWQRITEIMPLRQDPKTNPNEPKRTQNEPNFSLARGPRSQNEPKRTQNKPNSPKNRKSTQPQFPQRFTTKIANSPAEKRTRANPHKSAFGGQAARRG